MTNEGERVYLQCDPFDTGILDLDNYPCLLEALEPEIQPVAQQIFEDFILSEWKLVMTKSDFLMKFAGLHASKPPLAKRTSPQLIQKKTPKVFLDLSATLPQKENNELFVDEIADMFSRRLDAVKSLIETNRPAQKRESPRPVLKPTNKTGRGSQFIRKRNSSSGQVYTKKIIQAGTLSNSNQDMNFKNKAKLMEIRKRHLQTCSQQHCESARLSY